MAIRGRGTRGTKVEIGGQLIFHPDHDGLAEAADHDADRGHHRDGRGERADENGSPAQGSREAARSEHGFHAEKFAEKPRGKGYERNNERWHRQR